MQRILIVRLSAIGDVLHGLPVACALRDSGEKTFIGWVVESRAADLLTAHRAIDELIVVPRGWLKSPREVWKLARRLRELRFDATIDLQGLTKSALAARLSGAKRRIGFGGADGREISRWLNNVPVQPTHSHVVDRNLELLAPLGVEPAGARFDVDDLPADAQFARAVVESLKLGDRFGVINPGAGWPSKLWPPDRFAAVARRVSATRGLSWIVVWAGQSERAWAEQIVAESAGHAALAPATTLRQLAALARRATLFVASDTGPLHLAAAVGTPCVGLYGPVAATRNGPYGPQHVAVQRVCLTGGSRERRTASAASMEAISIDDVVTACCQVLDRSTPQRRRA